MKIEISRQFFFRKILKYQTQWKYVQWEPNSSMRTDRRTDVKKLIVGFCSFVNTPKNALDSNFYFHRESRVCVCVCVCVCARARACVHMDSKQGMKILNYWTFLNQFNGISNKQMRYSTPK